MTEIDYAARVAKGAALLDEKRPGWERSIDLETLDIADGTRCVTAQLSGQNAWWAGMRQLGLSVREYEEHGFNANDLGQGEVYATLNGLWRELIQGRLTAPVGA